MTKINRALTHYLVFAIAGLGLLAGGSPARAVSLQQELEMGRKVDAEILKQAPLSTDQASLKEIDELGQKIVKNVRRPEIKYHFRILNEGDDFDAFSIPGGYVYVSQRAWDMMRKDERTGVLGHEITHVDRRHAIDAMIKQQKRQILTAILLTAVGAGQAVANVADLANTLSTLKYSRGDEKQADENSVDLCQKAGFNPAGIYLAMLKLRRMSQDEGGEPLRILSTHPLTKDRIEYLQQLLANKGIPIPKDTAGELPAPDKIGSVTSIAAETIHFDSTKTLSVGNVVWLMRKGWDYRYENRALVPVARGVVTSAGANYTARIWPTGGGHSKDIAANAGVYLPALPRTPKGIGAVSPSPAGGRAQQVGLPANLDLRQFDRILAYETVYDRKNSDYVCCPVGYVVVTNPASPSGYTSAQRTQYSYAPICAGCTLVKISDPDAAGWVGTVTSVGKASQAVEVMPKVRLDRAKTYQITRPAWNSNETLEQRAVASAVYVPGDKKVVVKITEFSPGYSMADVHAGYDIYEAPPEKK